MVLCNVHKLNSLSLLLSKQQTDDLLFTHVKEKVKKLTVLSMLESKPLFKGDYEIKCQFLLRET